MNTDDEDTVGWPALGPKVQLTAADWMGAVAASLCALFCMQWPFLLGPKFTEMFRDFGSALPGLTVLVLTPWFPITLGLVPLAGVASALFFRPRLPVRLAMIGTAFGVSLFGGLLCLVAMYLPIFQLAGSVK